MNKLTTPLVTSFAMLAAASIAVAPDARGGDEVKPIAIKAKTIHIGDGTIIRNGIVLVEEGRITAVGADVAIPEDATIIDAGDGSITPGLIDANALLEPADLVTQPDARSRGALQTFLHDGHTGTADEPCYLCNGTVACAFADTHEELEPGQICPICGQGANGEEPFASGVARGSSRTEGSSEVVPHTLVIDALDWHSPDFDRLVREGVTTVFAAPDTAAVIGPRGAVLKTAGSLKERVLVEAGPVQAVVGADPYRYGGWNGTPSTWRGISENTRRPQSRMGVAWVFRKAFHEAAQDDNEAWLSGTDQPSAAALETLRKVASQEIPLRLHARTMRDIYTATRICDEFGLTFTLLEGTEAYRCLDLLKKRSIPVIFGPIYDDPNGVTAMSGETDETKLTTMRALLDAGIEAALSARDLREEDGLARQAMYAMRAGLTRAEAVRAVTLTPARLLGLDDQIGSIEADKHADIIIWNGEPFDATSQPTHVLVNGRIVFKRGHY